MDIYVFITITLSLFLSQCCHVLSSQNDEITSLPGLSHNPNFKQYSGYLNATKGRHLFYWFVESQSSPTKDPVVLWLNGGPGCSSLFGMLGENGPFKVNKDGKTLVANINSWNTVSNVLYLESPVGVGFSYDENTAYKNGDKQTAEDNYLALQSFFRKYPSFTKNPFYITGESYAGVYIPMLSQEIFKKNPAINLKGIAIGNGLLDYSFNSRIEFASGHGLISSDLRNQLNADCCHCNNNSNYCDFNQPSNPKCNISQKLRKDIADLKLNPYNIYTDCQKTFGYMNFEMDMLDYYDGQASNKENCPSNGYSQYLKSKEVRKAIHVNEKAGVWHECNKVNYVADRGNTTKTMSMNSTITELISKYKIQNLLIFNGDLDFVCDFIGNQQFVDGLGLKLTQKYKKWSVDGITAGFVKRFEGISFITVRGSGHMVPQDKPEAALKILKELIGLSKVDE